MWDPFHRIDAAAWRAIRSAPAAVLVFDTAKQLDYMFGQSDGALLYKRVAAFMGQDKQARQVRAPGGTRKIGYVAGTPGSILENLDVLLAAFHARVAWAKEGHGAQSLTHLLDVSRILTSVSFVTFAAALNDLFGLGLRPFTLQMQGILQPSAFFFACRETGFVLFEGRLFTIAALARPSPCCLSVPPVYS